MKVGSIMQAALIREHGGPERMVVETMERPEPGPGEAVVRVGSCALNHLDIFVRRGMPGLAVAVPAFFLALVVIAWNERRASRSAS